MDVEFLSVEQNCAIDLRVSLPEAASSSQELLGRLEFKLRCVLSGRCPSACQRRAIAKCGFETTCTKSIGVLIPGLP